VLGLPLLKVIVLIDASAVTVTEAPARIIASSPFPGAVPLDQVEPTFQLPPAAVVVLVAPIKEKVPMTIRISAKNFGRDHPFNGVS
jgi:hypothetical protein